MKKKLIKILQKQQLIIGVSIVFSVILIVALAPAIYLRFTSWRAVSDVNTQDLKKLQNATENLALLQSVDNTTVDTYKALIEKIVPKENDQLRVVSLVDRLAKSSGVLITSIKIGGGSSATAAPATSVPGSGAAGEQSSTQTQTTGAQAGESTTPQSGTSQAGVAQAAPPPAQPSSINLNITFTGTFTGTLKFLNLLENVKRTIGVKNISFTGEDASILLTINADFTLPLSQEMQVTSQDKVQLTQKDSLNLNDLVSRLTIDVVPTTLPTGRSDPFN